MLKKGIDEGMLSCMALIMLISVIACKIPRIDLNVIMHKRKHDPQRGGERSRPNMDNTEGVCPTLDVYI